ncbi:MAG TPA: hypothetical protein VE869_04120 [Gemmatimonas sp.]|nr:hypothetical protein [Gemmatimonas sp.]
MAVACIAFVVACAVSLSSVAILQAQGPPQVDVRLVPAASAGTPSSGSSGSAPTAASVAVRRVLDAKSFDELLRNGFPARLHVRGETWTIGRWFDEIVGREEWDVIVRFDLIDKSYEVARVTSDAIVPLGTYARFADARAASELSHAMQIPAAARGRRGYVNVQVDVQTVEMSDLDEVQRWLRGEARPVVQLRRSPGTALTRGLRTLVSRLLGGEVRLLEARTPTVQF